MKTNASPKFMANLGSDRIRSQTNRSGRFNLMVDGIFPDSR